MLQELITGLETSDPETVTALLAQDVTLHVAVHDAPFEGKQTTAAILSTVLDGVFSNINATNTIESPEQSVVMFDLDVINYPKRAHGVLFTQFNDANQIQEIVVFLRPLDALGAVAEEMGRRLGGPRPEAP